MRSFFYCCFILNVVGCDRSAQKVKQDIFGTWDCIERDGLGFPIVYEGDAAQESLEDPNLQIAIQTLQMEIQENFDGILISYFDMTDIDGLNYEFDYPMPLSASGVYPKYTIVAVDDELGETITMNCTLTKSEILTCSYKDSFDDSGGTINFRFVDSEE